MTSVDLQMDMAHMALHIFDKWIYFSKLKSQYFIFLLAVIQLPFNILPVCKIRMDFNLESVTYVTQCVTHTDIVSDPIKRIPFSSTVTL
jgi:hypothetical protein